jgi:Leucine Rich repeats (2 copies)
VDLKGFANLKSLNAYSNKFENLDCLNNLPAKDKLQKINFYGNTIKEVDFATLLTQFPNLQYLNLENNPVSAINLQKLSKEQLKILVEKIKDKKFRVNSYRGTVLQDLLFYLQSLGSSHAGHAKEIAALIQTNPTQNSPTRGGNSG